MNAYYKARVLQDLPNDQYVVETKRHWFSKWCYETYFTCEEPAVKYCNSLVKRSVVYEVKK